MGSIALVFLALSAFLLFSRSKDLWPGIICGVTALLGFIAGGLYMADATN